MLLQSFFRLMAAICCFMLAACSLAPGQRMDLGASWQSGQSDLEQNIVVREISPRTVLQLEQERSLQGRLPVELTDYTPQEYRIGPGDALLITVWDHPELTIPAGQFVPEGNARLVRADGSFYYPYLGNVQAAGLTLESLRAQMSKQLVKFITAPQIDISILRYASQRVFLGGAFVHSEPLVLTSVPLSLAEALGKATINPEQADLAGLRLRRNGKEYRINLDALAREGVDLHRVFLLAGDSIHLPFNDRKKIFVMGEVGASRALTFKTESMSLADALGSVSGLRQDAAKASDVYVVRPSQQGPDTGADVFRMNANSPISWVMAGRFMLQPGDVVFVDTASIVRFNRVVSGLFPLSFLVQSARSLTQ